MFSQAIGERLTPVMRWHASRAASSWPRAVGFGLTLSLAKLPPEAATRLGQTATFPIGLCLHGDGNASSPHRRPKASERLTQTVLHPKVIHTKPGGRQTLFSPIRQSRAGAVDLITLTS